LIIKWAEAHKSEVADYTDGGTPSYGQILKAMQGAWVDRALRGRYVEAYNTLVRTGLFGGMELIPEDLSTATVLRDSLKSEVEMIEDYAVINVQGRRFRISCQEL
jgi:hypothetical protein